MTTDGDKSVRLEPDLNCRKARRLIHAQRAQHLQAATGQLQPQDATGEFGDSRLKEHLMRCARCQIEARIDRFYRLILTGYPEAASAEAPDEIWFRGLRARIERESSACSAGTEDSFARMVSVVARQMVPV